MRAMTDLSRCAWADSHPLLRDYHDHEYGLAPQDDRSLYELLTLEVFRS